VSEPAAGPAILQGSGLSHAYEGAAWRLDVPGFRVFAGEVVCAIGPNGSGKSTLLRILAGIVRPLAGEVLLCGDSIAGLARREVARRLGYLPQNVAIGLDYTAEEVVRMGRYAHTRGLGVLAGRDVEAVERGFRRTETEAFRGRRMSRLSGGERQRVLLASVLAQEPRALLLDEPTSALDIHHQVRFFTLLGELARGGLGVCVVTHDLNLASLYGDRLVLLSGGSPVAEGSAEDVLRADVLASAYGEGLLIERHPRSGRPVVLPSEGRSPEGGPA